MANQAFPRSKTNRRSFFACIADYDIFIEVDGNGPHMIMTHGLGANTTVFGPLQEIFATDYTVVRIDWPGLGHSGLNKSGAMISMPSLVEVLEGVMDVLEIRGAILVGHSLGGVVSMMLAAKSPTRVHGLAVIGAGRTRATQSDSKVFTLNLARQARRQGLQEMVDDLVTFNIPFSSPRLARALLRSVTTSSKPEGYAQICEALCDESHRDPDYSRIVCPACVIGGQHDNVSPINITEDLVELIAGSGKRPTCHILNTGHMMIIEDVEGTAAAIRRMLEGIDRTERE